MPPKPFYGRVHAFRAFAIVNVVAVHALAGWFFVIGHEATAAPSLQVLARMAEVLFHDSTVYFALISGLLYSLVLHGRGRASFVRGKALNVLLPYLVMTALFTAMDWNPQAGWLLGVPKGGDYFHSLLHNLASGQAVFVYWYIPVLLVLFALTPWLHRAVSGTGLRTTVPLLAVLALPIVFSRTGVIATPSSVLYFAAPYALGIWLGQAYDRRIVALAPWRPILWLLAIVCSPLLYWLVQPGDDRPTAYFFSATETLFYVQKTALALLVLQGLARFDAGVPPWMGWLADRAFAIYFLHIPVMLCVVPWALRQWPGNSTWPRHLAAVTVLFLVALGASATLVAGLQSLCGRRSRWLVGA